MTTFKHCPGHEPWKNLSSFICTCSNCGKEHEIFSDELNRKHICKECGSDIAVTGCEPYTSDTTARTR